MPKDSMFTLLCERTIYYTILWFYTIFQFTLGFVLAQQSSFATVFWIMHIIAPNLSEQNFTHSDLLQSITHGILLRQIVS